jgi:hypothetical protein
MSIKARRRGYMNRSGKPPQHLGSKRQNEVEDIEREFLGLSLDIARLREKVLALAARLKPQPTSPSCSP